MDDKHLNQITERIIGSAIEVHRNLGPGLLESAYEACLYFELLEAGLEVERQKSIPLVYKKVTLECGYRVDLFIEHAVVVELKVIDKVEPVHKAQLLSYLRLMDCRLGLLINFNVKLLKNGIYRIVNKL